MSRSWAVSITRALIGALILISVVSVFSEADETDSAGRYIAAFTYTAVALAGWIWWGYLRKRSHPGPNGNGSK